MAKVVIAPAAAADLDVLIGELNLPGDTRSRVRLRLSQLAEFPESGEALSGRWHGFRYIYDGHADQVAAVRVWTTSQRIHP